MVAKYEYDDWGNVLTVSNASNQAITDPNHIATSIHSAIAVITMTQNQAYTTL